MRNNRRDLNTGLPQNIYNAMERHPELAQAFENACAMMHDTAELKLSESVSKGKPWAICFYLRTQGRKRGYVEKREISIEGRLTLEQAGLAAYENAKRGRNRVRNLDDHESLQRTNLLLFSGNKPVTEAPKINREEGHQQ